MGERVWRPGAAPTVALEPVAEGELDALFSMFADYWRELDAADPLSPLSYGVPEYHRALLDDREGRDFLWIVSGGERAGFALTRLDTDWPGAVLVAEVSEFYVLPRFRRTGIGRAAVGALSRRCRALGAARLEADVLSGNPGALAFWRACGLDERRRSLYLPL